MSEKKPEWFQKLELMTQELAARESCYLYDLELVGLGKGRTLRVYVDNDSENGAGIEDCTNVARALNELLDKEDLVPGEAYNLEVSTPGAERPLRKKWHFEKVKGRKIWVKLLIALGEIKEIKGLVNAKKVEDQLVDVKEESLLMSIQGQEVEIPLRQVEKANLVFELLKGSKKN